MSTELATSAWLVRPRPVARPRLRLFCFPYAGGGASAYRGWAPHMPPDIDVVAVQLPGREERLRETPFHDLRELLPVIADELAPWLNVPYALFGHSMGALIAFELARTWAAQGRPETARLFVSAHCGPRKPHCLPSIEGMSDVALAVLLKQLGGSSDAALADRELMEIMLPLIRADLTICERYRYAPGEPLSSPVTALGGIFDTFVRRSDVAAWRAETRGAFDQHMFPGGHFFLDGSRARVLQLVVESLAEKKRSLP